MKNWTKIVFLSLFVAGCTGYDANNAKNMKKDFTGYYSFAWLPKDSSFIQNVLFDNSIIGEEIVEAVNQELESKGYSIDRNNPDLLMKYTIIIENKEQWMSSPVFAPNFYRQIDPFIPPYNPGTYFITTIQDIFTIAVITPTTIHIIHHTVFLPGIHPSLSGTTFRKLNIKKEL
jgi:hypothetical protein